MQVEASAQADGLIGNSPAAARLRLQIARFAPHFRAVLLVGEAHTGKRSVAQALHRLSPATAGPFLDYTPGPPEPPVTSTLYLPHLERLSLEAQHALQLLLERMSRDTRLIAASEADPRGLLAAGRLQPSLYQKLGMLELRVPPLRERLEDLPALAADFLARLGHIHPFPPHLLAQLQAHSWPGNLAELAQVCRRHAAGHPLELRTVPPAVVPEMRLDDVMRRHVMDVLERCAGNKLRTAELLGISRSTLYRMLEAAA